MPDPLNASPIARDLRLEKTPATATTPGMYIRPKPKPVRRLWPMMRPQSPVAKEAANHPPAATIAPLKATLLGPYLRYKC